LKRFAIYYPINYPINRSMLNSHNQQEIYLEAEMNQKREVH